MKLTVFFRCFSVFTLKFQWKTAGRGDLQVFLANRTQELPVAVYFGLRKKMTCACTGLLGGRGL